MSEQCEQAPVRISGPFFVVRSACEEDREDRPYFVLSRRPCDVVFPTGQEPRRWHQQWYAQETADYCNSLVQRIAELLQQRKQGGWLLEDRIDSQVDILLDELQVICFFTEDELLPLSYASVKIA